MKINYLTEQDWPTDDISDWSDEDWERWNNRNNHEEDIEDDYDDIDPEPEEPPITIKVALGRSSNPKYLIFNVIVTSYIIAKHLFETTNTHNAKLGEPNRVFLGENVYTGNNILCVRTANPYKGTVTIGEFVRTNGTHNWYATIYNGCIYIVERLPIDNTLSFKNKFTAPIDYFINLCNTKRGFSYKLTPEELLYFNNQFDTYKSLPVADIHTKGYLEQIEKAFDINFINWTGKHLKLEII